MKKAEALACIVCVVSMVSGLTACPVPLSDEKSMTDFSIPAYGAIGEINEPAGRIVAHVPFDADVSALVASFVVSPGAVATVGDVAQESGVTPNNFSSSLTYRVTAEDGSFKDYLVTVGRSFTDDFEREDSATLGNGWAQLAGGPGTASSLAAGEAVLEGPTSTGSACHVYRAAAFSGDFRLSTVLRFGPPGSDFVIYLFPDGISDPNYNYAFAVWGNGTVGYYKDMVAVENTTALTGFQADRDYRLSITRILDTFTYSLTDTVTDATVSESSDDFEYPSLTGLTLRGPMADTTTYVDDFVIMAP
jgi:hypothetical protein